MHELAIDMEPVPDHRVCLVRPVGVLTRRNRHRLRAVVLKCLAECPAAVVVDLTEVELVDGIAAAIFVALSREAATGPGISVLLCGARGFLARRLKALDPRQPQYPTVADAIDAIDRGHAVRNWIYKRLPAEPESASIAGCLVADACVAWQMPQFIYATRTVTFGLMRDAYRCPVTELHLVMSQRAEALLLSIRSRTTEHFPDCVEERESPVTAASRVAAGSAGSAATYHHTITSSDHIGWALLPT